MNSVAIIRPEVVSKTRILLVDNHPMTRIGMCYHLSQVDDFEVVGQVGTPNEAMSFLDDCDVNLVVTDLNLPGKGGLELIKDIRAIYPEVSVLVVSIHDEVQFAPRALKAGAKGYIAKNEDGAVFIRAIRQVMQGRLVVSERMSALILDIFAGNQSGETMVPESRLSDRELCVLQQIGSAQSTRSIAKNLCISTKTVETHRANIRKKLGVENTAQLVRYAMCWVSQVGRGVSAEPMIEEEATILLQ